MRLLVEKVPEVVVVAEASDGREAIERAVAERPDLVIMDISMRELNGIEATSRIRDQLPGTSVLILSSHATAEFVGRALSAGASGYVVKDAMPQELSAAITAIRRGQAYLSPTASQHVAASLTRGGKVESPLQSLSPRQREILQMIAEGKTVKQIAFNLGLSGKTVETHRAELMRRLDIHDVAGLTLFALRNGLIDGEASAG